MPRKRRKTSAKKVSRRRVTRYSGLNIGKKDFVKPLINSGIAVGGAIAGSMIANKLPIADAKLKAGVPILAGLLLGMSKFGKKDMVQNLASGMMIAGGLSLVRQFVPSMPLLAGENEVDMLDSYGSPIELGYEGSQAMPLEQIGEEEFYTAANVL